MHLLSVFSLRNRALIALVTIVVAVFGVIGFTSLKQELFPSISLGQLVVVTTYPGASPDVVETDVSTPIETAIQAVPGLSSSTATSSAGLSSVSASFNYGTDLATAEQKVQLAIDRIKSQLPSSVTPTVITGSLADIPIVRLAVTSDLAPLDLSQKLRTSTITDIQALDGVRQADLLGTSTQRITITPDLTTLAGHGLTTQAIRDALKNNGTLLPSGTITENDSTLTVQSGTRLGSADDVAALPLLGGKTSGVVTIGDVAAVAIVDDPVTGISRTDGKPSLTLSITKTPAGNTVAVSNEVRALIPQLESNLGNNTKFTVVLDQAPFVEQSINSLATEGLLGLLFAVVIIFLFLFSFRSTIVAAISIPVSVLIAFIGMLAAGYTLNVITLGALTIAIGRVVDDSIVVIENIKRHLSLGEEKLPAILAAVREVAGAVTASTLTTVAVFLPIALVGDLTGELFRPFALTVTIALAASLFVALTIVPVLAYWFLKAPKPVPADWAPVTFSDETQARDLSAPAATDRHKHITGVAPAQADELARPTRLQRIYLPVIRWTLKAPAITLVSALVILIGSGLLATQLKTNLFGDSGQNTLSVTQTLPLGASLAAKDAAAKTVEAALIPIPGITTVQTSIGSNGNSFAALFGSGSDVTYSLTTDPSYDQVKLRDTVRTTIAGLDTPGKIDLQASGGGINSSTIDITVKATSQADLQTAAASVLDAVKGLSVTSQAVSNLSEQQPYIAINVDRAKAAAAGLNEITVGGIITEAMLPASIGSVVVNEKTLSVYIVNTKAPTTLDEIKAFQIPTATGLVRLDSLATVAQVNGPSNITTIRGVRSATVSVTAKTDNIGAASAAVTTAVQGVTLPTGATATIGGVTTDQATAFSQLFLALLAAILIVYVIMVATFKSLRQPLLLLVSVPFAATGAIILQVVSGVPLGVASIIGVLMLIGIVVTNAIVLIDLVNQYRARGLSVNDAIIQGASRRLRPILMTAFATIGALFFMAIGVTGHGGFISQPLAIVVIGGLISSTLLTLVVLPTLYSLVEGAKGRRDARRAARAEAVAA